MLERLSSRNTLRWINSQHAVDESFGFHCHRVPFRWRILRPNTTHFYRLTIQLYTVDFPNQ